MSTPLLTTKLYIPRSRPELVSRPRLIERLVAGLQSRLILVSAPAGFGKTTLLGEWASRLESSVAWVSLDKDDNDPVRFWRYVVAALQTVRPDAGESALAMLQSPQPPSMEPLLTGLINELSISSAPLVLVLDDYHVIANQQISQAVLFLVDNLPPQVHLVIAGRSDPPWSLARLRARGEMTELRVDDLRFTPEEASAFLNDVMGLELDGEDIAALENRTEGWGAGLHMAAISVQGRQDVTGFIRDFSGSHRFILDYLVEEVLERQPAEVQEFLLKTSILERMCAPLCDAVTGGSDSQEKLVALEQANLFLVPLDDERRWYRYHHLFLELLRSRLGQMWPDEEPALHSRASSWYMEAGLVEEAVAHALAGDDMGLAIDLIEANSVEMMVLGKLATLSWWLEALPQGVLRERPWLLVYLAWARYWVGVREEGERSLLEAEKVLDTIDTPEAKQLTEGRVAVIRAYYAITNEETEHVLELAEKAFQLLPEDDPMYSMAAIALGGAYWGRGDVTAAERAFAKGSETAQRRGHRSMSVSAWTYMGIQQVKQGRLHDAHQTYAAALDRASGPSGRELPVAGFPMVHTGDLLREWNDLAAARRMLERGVDLCRQWGQADAIVDGLVALTRLLISTGERFEASTLVQEAVTISQRTKLDPWVTCWLDECLIRMWLATENWSELDRWAESSSLELQGELSYQHDLHHSNLARLLLSRGRRDPAGSHLADGLELLERLLDASQSAGWVHESIKVLTLKALTLQASGDDTVALEALAEALDLAAPAGYVRLFVDEGEPMSDLLRRMIVRGTQVAYAGKLLGALGEDAVVGMGTSSVLIDPISEREMEVLRLLAVGLTRSEIAEELIISVNTVRTHVKNIYGKLGVHSKGQAIRRAKELGLL